MAYYEVPVLPDFDYGEIVKQFKLEAESRLQQQDYTGALRDYNQALELACKIPYSNTTEEIPKILCNRSMVRLKLKKYDEAMSDANFSIRDFPYWIKGYWRGSNVLKETGQIERAVDILNDGLAACIIYSAPKEEQVILFVEMSTLLCQNKRSTLNRNLQIPRDDAIKARIIQRLILNKSWENISYLVTGVYPGNNMDLAGCFSDLNFSFVHVGNLLKQTSVSQKKSWGIQLAIALLRNGASYEQMELGVGQAAIHIGVQDALETGSIIFLKFLLGTYIDTSAKKDMINSNGDTAIHVVIKTGETNGTFGEAILRLLINNGCKFSHKDMSGKLPIEYLKPTDQGYTLLQTVNNDPDSINTLDKRLPKTHKHQQSKNTVDVSWLPKMPLSKPQYDKCRKCEDELEMSKQTIDNRPAKTYISMAKVIQERSHDKTKHQKIVDEMLTMITESIAKTLNPEIPKPLLKIMYKQYLQIVNGLLKGENWTQLVVVVDEYRKCHGKMELPEYAKRIKLSSVIMHSSMKGSHQLLINIITSMLKSGAEMENDDVLSLNYTKFGEFVERIYPIELETKDRTDIDESPSYLDLHLEIDNEEGKICIQAAVQENQFKILETLFSHGACPSHLSVKQGDTPIHAALSIAIEKDKGNFSVFNLFLEMFEKDQKKYNMLDPTQKDINGDSLFHLVAKTKYNSIVQKATELLCDKKMSSNVKNNDDKLPVYYLKKKNDRRLQFVRLANDEKPTKSVSRKSGKMNRTKQLQTEELMNTKLEGEDLLLHDRRDTNHLVVGKPSVKQPLGKQAVRKRIEKLLHNLNDAGYSKYSSRSDDVDNLSKKSKKEKVKSKIEMVHDPGPYLVKPKVTEEPALLHQGENEIFDDEEDSDEEQFKFDPQVFENLAWEVVCTADVWKALSSKHVLPEIKQRIVCKIQHLAAGNWIPVLSKKLNHVPDTLMLFEAKITKASRIIWEQAIAFSPRLSESAEKILECNEEQLSDRPVKGGKIYSEVIRVWDIVFDHDKIYSSVQRIVKSHERGEDCIIQKKIKGIKHEKSGNELKKVPRIYAETDIERSVLEEIKPFFPPASANETEYHILKFYSFSSHLVSHILQNIEIKVDFPFCVTGLEHDIINIPSNAPILLIGRSGTGKTTCCLYRLWSRFLQYWTKAVEADAPLLPRVMIYKQEEKMQEGEMNTEEANDLGGVDLGNVSHARKIPESCHDEPSASKNENKTDEQDEEEVEEGQQYDHLHQIFITKNAVLCNEVQKNFRELLHGCDQTKQHVEAEPQNLPNRLQDLNDYQFPLFITSKQLLLMLDASVDQSYFFDRTEDGSLKVDIPGWTDGDGPLSILHLLQESDGESDSDEEIEDILEGNQDNQNQGHQKRKKVAPRREMTYELFAETIWAHINKGIGKKYHPSLVWTEIMSFIKGSYEALSKLTGYLEKGEYFDLGRKRAPNFSGEREHIYTLFKRYEHARKQNFLFDETDLVRDVYQRLCKQQNMDWVIHQIFVDETQDFTQAELCLLLRLCQNPNDMFLTGDTAQGIMRGISFRFNDLKSLFFYASHSLQAMGKTTGIAIPEQVHQLTHNYRSHAGILTLASSILDILVELFPESFDRLNKDQGLFKGPEPVLLESCSFSDLALLLRGNKRKTSHIEFGAHQAILVVNDAARENVPEELQCGLILTIYEAKGLEFDDILLYNFFRDSQAKKEWRVITDFLEKLCSSDKTSTENLVKISSDILEQKDRPRALTFDPNQHKLLNSELKHLYTAVTRARVNVWIFDEDKEKRAPMFEYFKAQNLVKVRSIEDAQNLSTSGMFAEESAPEEWIKRAQEFMKNNLYEVAAKSYRQGGDDYMANVAMCHQMALKASRIKDNPALMREAFLLAAEKYLEVELPAKAAICLQNAREKELMAYAYDKMGQFEKAAETYRKLKRPKDSSACYERFGFFDKAISTLNDHKYFDMASDICKRYKLQIKEFEETGKSIPEHLIEHAPGEQHTEEQLAFAAADLHHSTNNIGRMMASLNRLPNIDHRINFLTKHHTTKNNYMSNAAEILMQNGCMKEAAELYLKQGKIRKALVLFREMEEKDLVGYCQIMIATIDCTTHMDESVTSEKLDQIKQDLQSAIDLYHNLKGKTCYKFDNPKHGAGEAELLLGQLTDDIKRITTAFANFTYMQQKQYKAGQLECSNWMVNHSDLSKRENLVKVINAMQDLFEVLSIVLTAEEILDKEYLKQIFMFYGLERISDTHLVLNPQHKPRILKLDIGRYVSENDLKTIKAEINTKDAVRAIAEHLINRGREWFKIIEVEIHKQHRRFAQCPLYTVGLRKNIGSDCCGGLHKKVTQKEFRELIEIDQLFIAMEYYVDEGISVLLKKTIPSEIKSLLEKFINKKYCSCELLVGDLFQYFRHGTGISDTIHQAMELQTALTEYQTVQMCMTRYFEHEYDFIKEKTNLKRERNTELFMKMVFLMKLMKLDLFIETLVSSFEKDVQKLCMVRQFLDAYGKMYSSNNKTREALILFAKFIQQVRYSNYELIFPDLTLLLTWTEFFTTTALCMEGKFSSNPDPWFVVPSSYIALVYFIDSSYRKDNGITTFESITRQKYAPESDKIRNRIERFIGMLAGTDNRMNVIRKVFQNLSEAMSEVQTGDDPKEGEIIDVQYTENALNAICIAERLLVLSLILLANMGMTVYSKSESYIIRELCRIELPLHCPERLVRALEKIKCSRGVLDIVGCLQIIIYERDDDLLLCRWDQNKNRRYGLVSEPLQEVNMFSATFSSPETNLVIDNPEIVLAQQKTVVEEDIHMVDEQTTDVEAVRKQLEDGNKRNKSAVVITKFFRRFMFIRKCKILRDLCEKGQMKERLKDELGIFADIVVDDKMCGICGEVFEDAQKESSKHASYAEITRRSIDNSSRQPTSPLEAGSLHLIKGMEGHQSEISATNASKEVTQLSQKESHMSLQSHCQKQTQFTFFREQYVKEIKKNLDDVKIFIEKYELRSTAAKTLYKDFSLKVIDLLSCHEKLEDIIRIIMETKDWGYTTVLQKSREMIGNMKEIDQWVSEIYSKQSKLSAKPGKLYKTNENDDFDEDVEDDVVPVVEEPLIRRDGKNKRKKKKNGKHN